MYKQHNIIGIMYNDIAVFISEQFFRLKNAQRETSKAKYFLTFAFINWLF